MVLSSLLLEGRIAKPFSKQANPLSLHPLQLRTSRTSTSSSVLSAVRARHASIRRIEATLVDLGLLFQQLAEQVESQEYATAQIEQGAEHVVQNVDKGTERLEVARRHAWRARRLKWWCLGVVVLVCCVLGLVLGLVFGLKK